MYECSTHGGRIGEFPVGRCDRAAPADWRECVPVKVVDLGPVDVGTALAARGG